MDCATEHSISRETSCKCESVFLGNWLLACFVGSSVGVSVTCRFQVLKQKEENRSCHSYQERRHLALLLLCSLLCFPPWPRSVWPCTSRHELGKQALTSSCSLFHFISGLFIDKIHCQIIVAKPFPTSVLSLCSSACLIRQQS